MCLHATHPPRLLQPAAAARAIHWGYFMYVVSGGVARVMCAVLLNAHDYT